MPSPGITKHVMAQAMKELMAEKPMSKISVGDIVERCDLNRNSFYYHFKDKYDLVNWIFSTELMQVLGDESFETSSSTVLIEKLCAYLYDNKEFYINALNVDGQNSFSEYLSDMIKGLVFSRVDDLDEDDEYSRFFASFITDVYLSAIFRWIHDGAKIPPEQFVQLFKKAAVHMATVTLEGAE